jgi:uncharacterized protein YjbJ (UPF0337 family)
MAGTGDKMKGAIKETAGKLNGDKGLEAEGKIDKAKGDVKDAVHNAKNAAKNAAD